MSKQIIVGMSGGVDSSVAAYKLKNNGYDTECVFMKNWDDNSDECSSEKDYRDALQVCNKLKLPLHTVNFTKEYKSMVFSHFLEEEKLGRTPNPDILCNQKIKFKLFLEYALSLDADLIATGHYARVDYSDSKYSLLKGLDKQKDQSYFLHAIDQWALSHTVFPLGDCKKSEVRYIASKENLITSKKKDSTGICFIGERNFPKFLQRFLPKNPGNIINDLGKVIGQHDGLMFYTIGQRKGIGIGGGFGVEGLPWYVATKDITTNELVVVQGINNPLLYSNKLRGSNLNWIKGEAPETNKSYNAKIRYRQTDQRCQLNILNDNNFIVTFDKDQFAITPGQSIVFYCEEICLGGGIIEEKL